MPTVTDIANAALSHVGTRGKIVAIDESSAEAASCRTHLALVRDTTLRAFDWNFARLTQDLVPLPDPPARWRHKYALPEDCLRLRRLNDVPLLSLPETFCELAADRDGEGAIIGVVLTDAQPISAVYTARVDDPACWDPGFADALTWGLAARICFELTGKDDRARTLTQLWHGALQQAAAATANEGSSFARTWRPESLAARGYGTV